MGRGLKVKKLIMLMAYIVSASLVAAPVAAKPLFKTKTFKTDFLSFQLSNQWGCKLDGSEYVCRPLAKSKQKDALIIIAAKIPGKEDNLKSFYNYLKQPKKISDYKGRTITSKVNLIKYKEIKNTQWVDAIHLSSELKNFYTRYLATVKNEVAVLVTYSVSRTKHALYAAELNRMVSSIKVTAKPPRFSAPPKKQEKKSQILTVPSTQKK
jgi:phosphoribosylformylglycinamidine (FGAM) synthase PurS component